MWSLGSRVRQSILAPLRRRHGPLVLSARRLLCRECPSHPLDLALQVLLAAPALRQIRVRWRRDDLPHLWHPGRPYRPRDPLRRQDPVQCDLMRPSIPCGRIDPGVRFRLAHPLLLPLRNPASPCLLLPRVHPAPPTDHQDRQAPSNPIAGAPPAEHARRRSCIHSQNRTFHTPTKSPLQHRAAMRTQFPVLCNTYTTSIFCRPTGNIRAPPGVRHRQDSDELQFIAVMPSQIQLM